MRTENDLIQKLMVSKKIMDKHKEMPRGSGNESDVMMSNPDVENFTPKMRETYRPYLREARIVSEGFYGDSKNNIDHLFRKFGLY